MTHTEESRREAHEKILPKIGDRHEKILYDLAIRGTLTSSEIRNQVGGTVNSVRARLSELRDMGLIRACGRRLDKNTGIKITIWARNSLITPPPRKPTWKDRALVAEKELRLARLELEGSEIRVKRFLNG